MNRRVGDIIAYILNALKFYVVLGISGEVVVPTALNNTVSTILFCIFNRVKFNAFASALFTVITVSICSLTATGVGVTPTGAILLPTSIPLLPNNDLCCVVDDLIRFHGTRFLFCTGRAILTKVKVTLKTIVISVPIGVVGTLQYNETS